MKADMSLADSCPSFLKMASVSGSENGSVAHPHREGKSDNRETKFNLRNLEVPFEFREPFIVSGYRKPGITAPECLRSVFTTCNETINVWSHVLAAVHFVCLSSEVWSLGLADNFVYPLLSFVFGLLAMFTMSFSAHAFNSMSSHARHVCFFFDYAAISVYTFTAGLGFYFYSRPLNSGLILFETPGLFLTTSAVISLACTYFCAASRHRWIKQKYLIRTGTFFISFIFNTYPYTCRLMLCYASTDCNYFASLPFFKRHAVFYLLAALANVLRLPERFVEQSFDFLGQSHHLLHIFAALGSEDEFIALKIDLETRRDELQFLAIQPTFWNTLGVTALVIAANISIVLWFHMNIKDEVKDADPQRKQKST